MNTNQITCLEDRIIEYQKTQSEEAATSLLRHYEPMVRMAAGKMSKNHRNLYDDLFQVGQISLLKSMQDYDQAAGSGFEPYAMKSMIGRMKNYLRDKSWYVQIPRRIKEKSNQVQQAIDHLTMKLERSPDVHEIADYLDLSSEETMEILAGRECYQSISLDAPIQEEENRTLGEIIPAKKDEFRKTENKIILDEAMDHLGKEEKIVIHHIYVNGDSQRKIAKLLGISQMSVSRIQRRAVKKLRETLEPTETS